MFNIFPIIQSIFFIDVVLMNVHVCRRFHVYLAVTYSIKISQPCVTDKIQQYHILIVEKISYHEKLRWMTHTTLQLNLIFIYHRISSSQIFSVILHWSQNWPWQPYKMAENSHYWIILTTLRMKQTLNFH